MNPAGQQQPSYGAPPPGARQNNVQMAQAPSYPGPQQYAGYMPQQQQAQQQHAYMPQALQNGGHLPHPPGGRPPPMASIDGSSHPGLSASSPTHSQPASSLQGVSTNPPSSFPAASTHAPSSYVTTNFSTLPPSSSGARSAGLGPRGPPGSAAAATSVAGSQMAPPPPSGGTDSSAYTFGGRKPPAPPPHQSMSHSVGAGAAFLPSERPQIGPSLWATCPLIVGYMRNLTTGAMERVPLEVHNLQYGATIFVSQAFVEVQMTCVYPERYPDMNLMFMLPKTPDTVITDLKIDNLTFGRVIVTTIVPVDDPTTLGAEPGGKGGGGGGGGGVPQLTPQQLQQQQQNELLTKDPELFMMALPPAVPGDKLQITFSYLEPLTFEQPRYKLQLPTTLPPACLPQGKSVQGILDVSISISASDQAPIEWKMTSHPAAVASQSPGYVQLRLDPDQDWPDEADVTVYYAAWRQDMTAMLHIMKPTLDEDGYAPDDPRGSLCLMVTPPGSEGTATFQRSVIFMFDRSGSMEGEPLRYAKAALAEGLRSLTPLDEFTVVAFDHEALWWNGALTPATDYNLSACQQWINDYVTARGTTNMMNPLHDALTLLQRPASQGGPKGLPYVFLITDGRVDNEHEICRYVMGASDALPPGGMGPPMTTAVATTYCNDAASATSASVSAGGGPPTSYYSSSAASAAAGQLPPSSNGSGAPGGGQPGSGATGASGVTGVTGVTEVPGADGPAFEPRIFTFGIGPYCNHYFLKQLASVGRGMAEAAFRPSHIHSRMGRMLLAAAQPVLSDVVLQAPGVLGCELYPCRIPDHYCDHPLVVVGKYEGTWPQEAQLLGILPTGDQYSHPLPPLMRHDVPIEKLFAKGLLDQKVSEAWLAGSPKGLVDDVIKFSIQQGIVTPYTGMAACQIPSKAVSKFKGMLRAAAPSERRSLIAKYAIGGAAGVGIVAGVAVAVAFGSIMATMANAPMHEALGAGGVGGDADGLMGLFAQGGDCCSCHQCGDCGSCGDCAIC